MMMHRSLYSPSSPTLNSLLWARRVSPSLTSITYQAYRIGALPKGIDGRGSRGITSSSFAKEREFEHAQKDEEWLGPKGLFEQKSTRVKGSAITDSGQPARRRKSSPKLQSEPLSSDDLDFEEEIRANLFPASKTPSPSSDSITSSTTTKPQGKASNSTKKGQTSKDGEAQQFNPSTEEDLESLYSLELAKSQKSKGIALDQEVGGEGRKRKEQAFGEKGRDFELLYDPASDVRKEVLTKGGEQGYSSSSSSSPSSSSPQSPNNAAKGKGDGNHGPTSATFKSSTTLQVLRPYQEECVKECLHSIEKGEVSRIGVSSPTGSGKTVIFTELISRLPPRTPTATRSLVIVNSIQLARQAADHIEKVCRGMTVEIEQGKTSSSGEADVTIATIQTLSTSPERLRKFKPEGLKVVIVDEAHHSSASSYLDILSHFDSRILESIDYSKLLADDKNQNRADRNVLGTAEEESVSSNSEEVVVQEDSLVGDGEVEDVEHQASPIPSTSATFLDSDAPSPSVPVQKLSTLGASQETRTIGIPEANGKGKGRAQASRAIGNRGKVPIVGFSATFSRADGLSLSKVFQRIVFHKDFLEMIGEKWLSPVRFTTVTTQLDFSEVNVSRSTGDFNPNSLSKVLDTDTVHRLIVGSWIDRAGHRRSTLVFAVTISHVLHLTKEFKKAGVSAEYIFEGTPYRERTRLISDFREGKFKVLVNCAVLTEGADIPEVDCVLIARPTRSRNLFSQMMGRGLRLSKGKKDCLVLDIVGNTTHGIVCVPTLFGLDPDMSIIERTSDDLFALKAQQALYDPSSPQHKPLQVPDPASVTYTDYATVFDLIESMGSKAWKGDKKAGTGDHDTIFTKSPFAWVGCGNRTFVLGLLGKGDLRIEWDQDTESWKAFYHPQLSGVFHGRRQHVTTTLTIEEAVRACDTLARSKLHPSKYHPWATVGNLFRRAPWRRKTASPAQLKLVAKRLEVDESGGESSGRGTKAADFSDPSSILIEGHWVGRPWKQLVPLSELNKGQANDVITRLMHGAKGKWMATKKKILKREKEEERKGNERRERDTLGGLFQPGEK